MSTAIALAAPGLSCEAEVIARAASCNLEVRRRCLDAADLLGACLGGPGLVAVITAGLPRLSPDVVDRLRAAGSRVIAIALTPSDRVVLEGLGLGVIIDSVGDPDSLLSALARAIQVNDDLPGVWSLQRSTPDLAMEHDGGRVIAVWGPAGAPGRTTTALVLAKSLSEQARTVIIDIDTAAPSVALHLGLTDDLSGLIVACRHAEAGSLTSRALNASMSQISAQYFALTGISHARRWAELRPAALVRVLEKVRAEFGYAVIDLGAAFDLGAIGNPSPVDVTQAALGAADLVVAVCQAEPLGVARFLADLPALAALGVPIVAVISSGTQRDQARQLIRETETRLGLSIPIADLALDVRALSLALRKGISIQPRRRLSRKGNSAARLVELVA